MRLQRGRAADEIDIIVEAEDWRTSLPEVERVVERAAGAAFARATRGGGDSLCAILLSDDAELRALNRQFRGQDKPTNVLSFPGAVDDDAGVAEPVFDGERPLPWGDVAIAFETTAREAAEQGKSLADHLSHLVVHGLLHLFGYDHEAADEAETMEAMEREILAGIGVADPYAAESSVARGGVGGR